MTPQEQLLVEAARRGLLPDKPRQEPSLVQRGVKAVADTARSIEQGLTVGLGDELRAGVRALATDETLPEAFQAETERLESIPSAIRIPGEIAGGLVTGTGLARGGVTLLNAAKPTVGSMVARGAGEGAAYGAAYGFGTGEGLQDRLEGAAYGATLGAGGGAAVGAAGSRLAQRAASKATPSVDALRQQANQAYQAAENAGVVVEQNSFGQLVDDISTLAKSAGIDRTIHPKATAALNRLVEAKGTQPSLKDIDILRRVLKGAAGSIEADERRIARQMIDRLDEFVDNLGPASIVAGDAATATSSLRQARSLWSRVRKVELIEDAVERAQRRAASTGSGGNVDNAIRQNIRSILDNPKRARGFTKAEKALMERVVRGAPVQNLARLVGKLSPQGSGLMAALGIGATAANPLMATFPAAGFVAKSVADAATPRNVNMLTQAIRSGGGGNLLPLSPRTNALLRALMTAQAQQAPEVRELVPR